MTVRIVPSALSADYTRMGEECRALAQAGADRIQWDVMDGKYVPNITFGADVIAACREVCDVGFEAHIMCERPEELLPRYVEAGCELILLHPETLRQPHRTYGELKEAGARVGLALSPATPLDHVEHVLDLVDMILVMTVNPGFGGQSYLATMEPKIARARELADSADHEVEVEVDGGIGPDTIERAAAAGANVFISGSALWKYGSFEEGIADLRERAEKAFSGRGEQPE